MTGVLLDEQLCFPLYATSRSFTRLYARLLAPAGLTYAQYLVMLVLWEDGEVTVKSLGERLDLDSGTLTPMLKRLEQRGLVGRHRDSDDERRVLVTLTADGEALEEDVSGVADAVRRASGLSDREVDRLKATLERVLASLAQASS